MGPYVPIKVMQYLHRHLTGGTMPEVVFCHLGRWFNLTGRKSDFYQKDSKLSVITHKDMRQIKQVLLVKFCGVNQAQGTHSTKHLSANQETIIVHISQLGNRGTEIKSHGICSRARY